MNVIECLSSSDEVILNRLQTSPIEFIDNDVFRSPDAESKIFAKVSLPVPPSDIPFTFNSNNNTNLVDKLLTREQESYVFLQMNYCKYKISNLIQHSFSIANVKIIISLYKSFMAMRDYICKMNMRLCSNLVRKFLGKSLDMNELISDANIHLLYSCDKFDVKEGTKFSTYVYWSIVRSFGKTGKKNTAFSNFAPFSTDDNSDEHPQMMVKEKEESNVDQVDMLRNIIANNSINLSELDLKIVQSRYFGEKKLSVTAVAQHLGITPNIVRQREQKVILPALRKEMLQFI